LCPGLQQTEKKALWKKNCNIFTMKKEKKEKKKRNHENSELCRKFLQANFILVMFKGNKTKLIFLKCFSVKLKSYFMQVTVFEAACECSKKIGASLILKHHTN